ncbi:LCP family protein [[Clostridium] polysaccharolyticum]|uniref:Transcriptional attenuator, LytR family n=1 Tax=[Clostridium] polysaccharolyticum TaxID=29364 RepID=A0A1I0D1X0_9FIRM|nr:LCP family protein [[Clostridium] polysaccharolyticum]SET26081.1 transcriptional attenuator, LytR family [[Clostridium] polysaccharolyticum]
MSNRAMNKKRRKRKRIVKRIMSCLLVAIAIVSGSFAAKVRYEVTDAFATMDRDKSSDLSNVLDDSDLLSDDQIMNILLIGSDKRANWSQAGRSDSTMIATIDNKNKQLKLTSLMRDMYVDIPGHGKSKFNAAYSLGGVELLYETIAQNFNIKLDGYVLVDFEAFKSLIDEAGGVEVNLNQEEYTYLTTAYHRSSVLDVVPGLQTMNGEQALAYARIRQVGNNDFERTQRQRNVMLSLFAKAKAMPFTKLFDLGKTVLPYVTTDLSNDEIFRMGKTVLFMGTTHIHQMRIPVDNSYKNQKINKAWILDVDLAQNQQALSEFIFNKAED